MDNLQMVSVCTWRYLEGEEALRQEFGTPSIAHYLWPEASSDGLLEGTPKSNEKNRNEEV